MKKKPVIKHLVTICQELLITYLVIDDTIILYTDNGQLHITHEKPFNHVFLKFYNNYNQIKTHIFFDINLHHIVNFIIKREYIDKSLIDDQIKRRVAKATGIIIINC